MASNYYEFIIKGDSKQIRAYLQGFFNAKGVRRGFAFSEDHPIRFKRLKELLKYHGEITRVFVESGLRSSVRTAIRQAGKPFDFEVVESNRIRRGYFHFSFDVANKKLGTRIKRILGALPEGVRATDYDPEERVDPEATATEGYAPLHHYQFKGDGVIEGNVEGVYRMHQKMSEHEFFKCDDIDLHYQSN